MMKKRDAVALLAAAVRGAFGRARLVLSERNAGYQPHFLEPWPAPPIRSKLWLGDLRLQICLDVPLEVTQEKLYEYWQETLKARSVKSRQVRWPYFKLVDKQSQALRFPAPVGPALQNKQFAIQLALEVAHTAYTSLPVVERHFTPSSYVVTCWDGQQFGVRDYLPLLGAGVWSGRYSESSLYVLRGSLEPAAFADELAKVRSLLYSFPGSFGGEFKAVELALLILRVLTDGNNLGLLQEARQLRREAGKAVKLQAFKEALEVAQDEAITSDTTKFGLLWELLVPVALCQSSWHIHILDRPIADLAFKVRPVDWERIIRNLRKFKSKLEEAC